MGKTALATNIAFNAAQKVTRKWEKSPTIAFFSSGDVFRTVIYKNFSWTI